MSAYGPKRTCRLAAHMSAYHRDNSMSSRKRIVICGGGTIGAAIAYFTSRRGARPILIERHERPRRGLRRVVREASESSDWCRGTPVDQLARRSFEVHAELSSELGNPWGYRRLITHAGYAAEDDAGRVPGGRPWLSEGSPSRVQLGSVESTALVEPCMFTRGLMRAAEMQGAERHRHGRRLSAPFERRSARRLARGRRDRRRRCRRHRDGALVDPGCVLAAAAGSAGLQGP